MKKVYDIPNRKIKVHIKWRVETKKIELAAIFWLLYERRPYIMNTITSVKLRRDVQLSVAPRYSYLPHAL